MSSKSLSGKSKKSQNKVNSIHYFPTLQLSVCVQYIMKTFLLVDGHAIIHRAYHAIPPLHNKDGIPTNAVYGFFAMLHRATIDFKPDYLIVTFDTPKPTFRKVMYKGYQSKRPPMVDDLKPQIGLIKTLLDKAHIKRLEKEGFEADDIIGTLATQCLNKDIRVLILTGDKDIMQLSQPNIVIMSPQTGLSSIKLYTPEEVQIKMGIKPEQIPDFKALAGDPSDNYPGAEGIGAKTAAKLLDQFQTIENLYEHLDKVENEKLRNVLVSNKENVLMFKKIATIVTNIELNFPVEESQFTGFHDEMKVELTKLQLSSLLKRFFSSTEPVKKMVEEKKPLKPEDQMGLF